MVMRREKPPKYVLIPDTGLLWHDDKCLIVNPEFDSFLSQHSKKYELEVHVPEIVMEELSFQQSTSAIKSFEQILPLLEKLNQIIDKNINIKITNAEIKKFARDRAYKWAHDHKIKILPINIEKVDWNKIIHQATWRLPPFTFDSKSPEKEKGFRDTLILETAIYKSKEAAEDYNVVFISKDNLLRETAEKAFAGNPNMLVFNNLESFSSYLKLFEEKLTKKFIQNIQHRARKKFYSDDDDNNLWKKFDISSQIINKANEIFKDPLDSGESRGMVALANLSNKFRPFGARKLFFNNPTFGKLESSNIFYWNSVVTYSQPFQLALNFITRKPDSSSKKLKIIQFNVQWHATVKADGRFMSIELDEISVLDSFFDFPTNEQLINYYGSWPDRHQSNSQS